MQRTGGLTTSEFDKEIVELKEKFSLLERQIGLKADERVFTMVVSSRKEIEQLKDEIFRLREELKHIKKVNQTNSLKHIMRQAVHRKVV